jgi:hypothetical protein
MSHPAIRLLLMPAHSCCLVRHDCSSDLLFDRSHTSVHS